MSRHGDRGHLLPAATNTTAAKSAYGHSSGSCSGSTIRGTGTHRDPSQGHVCGGAPANCRHQRGGSPGAGTFETKRASPHGTGTHRTKSRRCETCVCRCAPGQWYNRSKNPTTRSPRGSPGGSHSSLAGRPEAKPLEARGNTSERALRQMKRMELRGLICRVAQWSRDHQEEGECEVNVEIPMLHAVMDSPIEVLEVLHVGITASKSK